MVLSFLGKGGLGKGGKSGAATNGAGGGSGGQRFAMLAEVRAYWEGLREGGALPERDRIDPRGISGALENTFLLERIAPGMGRFRIAGMQLHDLMGMDVRGMPLSALFDPAARTRLADGLESVFATPAVLEIWLEAERSIGRPTLEGRLIVLPLVGTSGETDLALGCLAMEGALGRAPRRFAISGLMSEVIERRLAARREAPRNGPNDSRGDRRLPDLPPLAPVQTGLQARTTLQPLSPQQARTLGAGFSEALVDFSPRPPRGKPKLRLVHSRD